MTPVTDEQVMRAALADLTSEQPPVPPGRFQAVRRRAIRQRRHQLAGAAIWTLAAAGIAVGLLRLPAVLHQQPQTRSVPGWALAWPDYRNGSVSQSVLNNAVLAWGDPAKYQQGSAAPSSPRQIARLVASYHVVWYVGQTVARGQEVAVMFEASSPDTGRVLVVGSANASEVMNGQPAWSGNTSPWVLQANAAPARPDSFGPDISEYLKTPAASISGSQVVTDNWIVVLMAPGAELANWSAITSSGATTITGTSSRGLFIADTGEINSDVMLRFSGAWNAQVPVGIEGTAGAPTLAPLPTLTPPRSFREFDGLTGQGSQPGVDDSSFALSAGPYAVVASCHNAAPAGSGTTQPRPGGHGPGRVIINGHAIGAITCDDQQHEIAVPRSALRPHGIMIRMASSDLTSWQLAFGRA